MNIRFIIVFSILQATFMTALAQFDIQGHRGCRGWMPENTVPAFIRAVEMGVTTLELDVVITADNQVLVSHDPFMSHEICKTPDGKPITRKQEKTYNIYRMTAGEAQQFDCGETFNRKFPKQAKIPVSKPLLKDVIDSVESFVSAGNLSQVRYNIETKSTPGGDHIFHPDPATFTNLVMDVVISKNIADRTSIQSFDVRTLQHLKQQNSPVKLVLLAENFRGLKYNLNKLGFDPDIYSPYYKFLTKSQIRLLHEIGIRVIPWTVNNPGVMQKLIEKGVDGIITDYPDRLKLIIENS